MMIHESNLETLISNLKFTYNDLMERKKNHDVYLIKIVGYKRRAKQISVEFLKVIEFTERDLIISENLSTCVEEEWYFNSIGYFREQKTTISAIICSIDELESTISETLRRTEVYNKIHVENMNKLKEKLNER